MADLVMDANYLVAALLPGRRRHSKAKDYWEKMQQGEHHLHLPNLALAEWPAPLGRSCEQQRQRSF